MRSFHQLTTTALLCHSWFDLCTLDTVLEIHSIPVYVFFSNCLLLKAKINSWKSLSKVLLYTFDLFLTIENCEFLLLRSIINIWKKYFDARFLRIFKHCATPSFFGVCAFNAIFDMCWLDCNEHVRWKKSTVIQSLIWFLYHGWHTCALSTLFCSTFSKNPNCYFCFLKAKINSLQSSKMVQGMKGNIEKWFSTVNFCFQKAEKTVGKKT